MVKMEIPAKVRRASLPAGFCIFVLAASVEDLPAQLPYALGASFADLARAFSGTDPDVLTRPCGGG